LTDFSNVEDPFIFSDEQRVKQVLLSLQQNAIKFTNKGYVKIEASVIDDGKYLKICVEDTGVGINYDDQEKLTELFGFIENK
jgi:two-component system sensor histidine kinase ChiS